MVNHEVLALDHDLNFKPPTLEQIDKAYLVVKAMGHYAFSEGYMEVASTYRAAQRELRKQYLKARAELSKEKTNVQP